MRSFKSTTIKSIIGSSKIIIEVPHQRPAMMYDTNKSLTDYVSDNSNTRLRDALQDNNHTEIVATLGHLKDVLDFNCNRHQGHRKRWLIKEWAKENLTGPQYLWLTGERKSR